MLLGNHIFHFQHGSKSIEILLLSFTPGLGGTSFEDAKVRLWYGDLTAVILVLRKEDSKSLQHKFVLIAKEAVQFSEINSIFIEVALTVFDLSFILSC